jgi:hypothetical protein
MKWFQPFYRKVLKQGHAIMYTDLSEREDDEMADLQEGAETGTCYNVYGS